MYTFITKMKWARKLIKQLSDLRTPLAHDYTNWEKKNFWLRLSGLNISRNGVAIDYGFDCITGLEENIHIDSYTAIGIGVKLWNYNEIKIGKFCMIAAGTTVTNGGHDKNSFEPFSGPLHIGNGCWIGCDAKVIGPLVVGDNAIIGAGSVVLHDVPAGSIVAGAPAKIIGTRILPEKIWHLGNTYFCPYTFKLVEDN